jgi:serine/threonine-protein kinase
MPTDRDLFQSALGIADPAARAEYLSANAPDAEQRARVQRLLAAHDAVGGFLEQPPDDALLTRSAVDLGATRTAGPDHADHALPAVEQAGEIIAGKYKLLQQIGEGGMGLVWMADQTEPVKRRVAVKLIRVDRGNSKTIHGPGAGEVQRRGRGQPR